MEKVPTEVRQQILLHMDLQSFKSMRLVSRFWADLGDEYLISPDFSAYPDRNDFQRLYEIGGHEDYRKRIKRLTFFMGELDVFGARSRFTNARFLRPPRESIEDDEEEAMEELEYCKSHFEFSTSLFHTLLKTTLPRLCSLEVIDISPSMCPFQSFMLRFVWRHHDTHHFPRVATVERCNNIFLSLSPTANNIKTFTHDKLPLEYWDQKPLILNHVSSVVENLTYLHLVLSYSSRPNDERQRECTAGLVHCLRATKLLCYFRLAFTLDDNLDNSIGVHREHNLKMLKVQAGIIKALPTWQHLHTLVLEGMQYKAQILAEFVLRHRKCLKQLRLGNGDSPKFHSPAWRSDPVPDRAVRLLLDQALHFMTGTLQEFAEHLRKARREEAGLKLEKLDLRGLVFSWGSFETADIRFTPVVWDCKEGLYRDDPGKMDWVECHDPIDHEVQRLVRGLHDFTFRDGLWPASLEWAQQQANDIDVGDGIDGGMLD